MAKEKTAVKAKNEKVKNGKQKSSKPAPKQNKQNKNKKPAFSYFKEVQQEMKRVTWPSRQEVYQSTILVLVVVGFFIIYVGVVDQILIQIIKLMTASITGGGQ